MASFDENGKYIKTNWKAGDKITATKLNKIEESIEAVNDNDISRHVEADTRLDALEAKDAAHDKEFTNVKNLIADNKAAAELGDYEINSRMTFLENELNDGIEEVHNVAETVDSKIAKAEADMTSAVNQGKADMEAMVAEVEGEMDYKISAVKSDLEAADTTLQNDINERLPLSGGTLTGNVNFDTTEEEKKIGFYSNGMEVSHIYGRPSGTIGMHDSLNNKNIFNYYHDTAGNVSYNTHILPSLNTLNIGNNANRWGGIYSRPLSIYMDSESHPHIDSTNLILNLYNVNQRGVILREYADGQQTTYFMPTHNGEIFLGSGSARWRTIYSMNNVDVSSDRTLKENIEYVGKAKSGLTYADMYNFVKDDLGLATYKFIGDDKLRMNFIAQDLLVNEDGSDNKVGQMIVNPVAVPTEEEIANGTPYPTLSYDSGMYTSVLAGALKEAINKIEQLEARINELENK